jgi:hypothetical protein
VGTLQDSLSRMADQFNAAWLVTAAYTPPEPPCTQFLPISTPPVHLQQPKQDVGTSHSTWLVTAACTPLEMLLSSSLCPIHNTLAVVSPTPSQAVCRARGFHDNTRPAQNVGTRWIYDTRLVSTHTLKFHDNNTWPTHTLKLLLIFALSTSHPSCGVPNTLHCCVQGPWFP